jgi:hypothetical protein
MKIKENYRRNLPNSIAAEALFAGGFSRKVDGVGLSIRAWQFPCALRQSSLGN